MSKTEWKQEIWNPIIGCSKISEGCKNCYAEKIACRLSRMKNKQVGMDYASVVGVNNEMKPGEWGGNTLYRYDQVMKPSHWKKPRMIFVCTMGDLFHESVSFDYINAVFSVMSDYDYHTYIVLTKRPERMKDFYNWQSKQHGEKWKPKSTVWLGVTVENQEQANKRIPILLQIEATKLFVSVEPMLSEINLEKINEGTGLIINCLRGYGYLFGEIYYASESINWVICAGETGHNARPMHPNWVKSLKDQCQKANVSFFFKSWGEWLLHIETNEIPISSTTGKQAHKFKISSFNNEKFVKVGKRNTGHLIDGVEYREFPNNKEVEAQGNKCVQNKKYKYKQRGNDYLNESMLQYGKKRYEITQ